MTYRVPVLIHKLYTHWQAYVPDNRVLSHWIMLPMNGNAGVYFNLRFPLLCFLSCFIEENWHKPLVSDSYQQYQEKMFRLIDWIVLMDRFPLCVYTMLLNVLVRRRGGQGVDRPGRCQTLGAISKQLCVNDGLTIVPIPDGCVGVEYWIRKMISSGETTTVGFLSSVCVTVVLSGSVFCAVFFAAFL